MNNMNNMNNIFRLKCCGATFSYPNKIFRGEKCICGISIKYNNITINFDSIESFNRSTKGKNDITNKIRESIVTAVINNKIPDNYYSYKKWLDIKTSLFECLKKLIESNNNINNNINNKNITWDNITKIEANNKGGRINNYDIDLTFTFKNKETRSHLVEFKFGASDITHVPQWSSPHNPSQYMVFNHPEFNKIEGSKSFESWFYDNYMDSICKLYPDFIKPQRDMYLKEIHRPSPNCVMKLQQLYYKGASGSKTYYTGLQNDIEKYKKCKEISKKAIEIFIDKAELDMDKLNEYFIKSQKNKEYIMYNNDKFHYSKYDINKFIIDKSIKVEKKAPYFICKNKLDEQIKIMLRWKNGNGIAYPAFQVK